MIFGLIGLWPFLRAAGLDGWRALGFAKRADAGGQMSWGFGVGFFSLALVVGIAVASGDRVPRPDHSAGAVFSHIVRAGGAALVVAPLEEILFRGALFGSLRKTFHWIVALLASSAFYALVHFLEHAEPVAKVDWASGFAVLGSMLAGFGDAQKLIPGFLNLSLAGIILGLAYQRSGSLYFSIGLHAGWIFWVKTSGFVTVETAASRVWFFGTGKLINGWLAFLVLAGLLAVLSRRLIQVDPQIGWKERRLLS
jgi:membrane protease YdiL (CAAX protease family)